jgi:hypothetical protein
VERRFPVIKGLNKLTLFLVMLLAVSSVHANERLVLIASAESNIDQLDSLEVRKLFLGLTVAHNGNRLRPLLNESDEQIRNVFLQNVVSMTDSVYDRRVLRLAMAAEANLPARYSSKAELLNAVASNRSAVSYAWARDVEHDKRFKILRTLWHD